MQDKKCSECGAEKPITEFGGPWKDKGKLRYDSRCKVCRKAYNQRYYLKWKASKKLAPDRKVCTSCEVEKKAKHFGAHPGRPDGLQSDCSQCRNEKQRLLVFHRQHSRSFALPEKKTCATCGVEKAGTDFYRQTAKKDGLASSCKKCLYRRKNSSRDKLDVREPTVTEKWCPGCLDTLPAEEFTRNRRDRTGLWTYCRDCEKDRKAHLRRKL